MRGGLAGVGERHQGALVTASPPGPRPISRRSWAIIPARMSSPGTDPAAGAVGMGGAVSAAGGGAGAAAAAFPANFTGVWHFGHLTLKARSGTLASSMTIFCAHCGQLACTRYLSIRSSNSDLGAGAGAGRRAAPGRLLGLEARGWDPTSPLPCVSSRSWRFVRLVA